MKLIAFRKYLMIASLAFFVLLSGSYEARAQGRNQRASNQDKKCAKFVNCHDASEGRLDGRGPRRGTDNDGWNWRHNRRGGDSDNFDNHWRRRRHDRERNFDRNHRRRHRNSDGDRRETWNRRSR